jgi:hypothetical protein
VHSDWAPPNLQSSVVLLNDTLRVLRDFRIPIEAAPLQVYHSVLVFMPVCALQECMASSVTSIVRMGSDRNTVTDSGLLLEEDSVSLVSAAFSSDGTQLVTGSFDDKLRVWDVVSGHKIATYAPDQAPDQDRYSSLRFVAFSPDDSHIAGSSGSFGSLYIWNHVTKHMAGTLDSVDCFVYPPNGENIATYGWTWIDNAVMKSFRVWNITTGSVRTVLTAPMSTGVTTQPDLVFCSVDKLCIALYTDSAQLQVWGVSIIDINVPHLLSRLYLRAIYISHKYRATWMEQVILRGAGPIHMTISITYRLQIQSTVYPQLRVLPSSQPV